MTICSAWVFSLGIDRFDAVFLLLEAVDDAFFLPVDTESDSFLFLSLWLLTERIGTEPYSQSRYNSNRSLFFILDLLLLIPWLKSPYFLLNF